MTTLPTPTLTGDDAAISEAERYPATYAGLPEPLAVPWTLRPVSSADSGIEERADGRMRYWIRHDVLRGVTPRMLAWWFRHLEGTMEVHGRTLDRYRVWHTLDHVHVSYAWRRPDGTVGPGAAIRIREVLGRDRRHVVNVTSRIEQLDEEGFVHVPSLHVAPGLAPVPGLARMEYAFTAVPGGTRYENCLLIGGPSALARLVTRLLLPGGHGERWIRHNVEEVGAFEQFLPELYYRETGRRR